MSRLPAVAAALVASVTHKDAELHGRDERQLSGVNIRANRRHRGARGCKVATVQFKICTVNALPLTERMPLFTKQVEELGLLLTGVQEARLRSDRAWRAKDLLLVSSARDSTWLLAGHQPRC